MKKTIHITSILSVMLFINACGNTKPPHHPKHPNYAIEKPTVKYKANKKSLQKMVKKLQGKPYVWAEEGPDKFDCSGLTYYMYGSMGIELPRIAREQAKRGKRIDVKDLKYGDLIFFATNRRNNRKITHVGMYLGDGWFTHASTVKHEVVYSNLFTSAYYKKKLRICRRYLPEVPLKEEPFWKHSRKVAWEEENDFTPSITTFPASKPKPEKTEEGEYYIQVGSFINAPSDALKSKIRLYGYREKVIRFNTGSQIVSKLLIGPYSTKEKVYSILKDVRQNIQKTAFIAEIR